MPRFSIKRSVSTLKKSTYLLFCLCLSLPLRLWAFNAYSNQELESLEQEFAFIIQRSDTVLRDPLCNQYINHLGRKLASSAKMHAPYFFIVKSNEINAFAGPGGYIGINTQLILTTDNANELASVMAHELAHVKQHHLYYMLEHQKHMRIPMLASLLAAAALGALNPTLGSGAMMASLTGFAQDNINFIRSNEKDADRIGIDILTKTGYNPQGMVEFFKKMEAYTRYLYSDNIPAILRTHPLDKDRIAEAEDRIHAQRKSHFIRDEDYAFFKERIRNFSSGNSKSLISYYSAQCKKARNQTACHYGYALALLDARQAEKAQAILLQLNKAQPDNIYLKISLAHADTELKQNAEALLLLKELFKNYPDNYAVLSAYTEQLILTGKESEAVNLLIKGRRKFKYDLPLCFKLARAQANLHQMSEAYFTQAQCMLLEGRHRDAVQQLKVAKAQAKNNKYMQQRISALIDEIKFMSSS